VKSQKKRGALLRHTNFVEIQAPVFECQILVLVKLTYL
jgi:hypothetical protein